MKRFLIIISYLFIVTTSYAQEYELSRAKRYIEIESYLEAAKLLRPLAEAGNAEAMHLAAGLFLEGKGVIKSEKQAEKYYKMAADANYEPAVVALFDYYDQTNKQVQAAQLLTNKYAKQALPGSLYSKYGLYIYHGKGNLKADKLKGWNLIYQNKGNIDEELKKDFYESLLNECRIAPDSIITLFCNELWSNKNTKLEWTINYLDDIMLFIKTNDSIKQKEIASLLNSMYKTHNTRPTSLLLSMVHAEGLGIPMDAEKALSIYSKAVNDETYSLLYENLYKNNEDGKDGHLKKNDFPNFFKNVILKDYRERAERWDYQKKLKEIKLSGANVFKVKSFSVRHVGGKLSFTFDIYNTSPNPTGRLTIADNAYFKYNGKYYKAKVHFFKDSNLGIKGHETTQFTVTSNDYMPSSGMLDYVQFDLKCDYGKGTIRATNVVWNEKFQR